MKKRKSGDGADANYTSKWIHFQQLEFLDDFVTAKKTVSNYHKVQYTFYIQHNTHDSMADKDRVQYTTTPYPTATIHFHAQN